MESLKHFNSPSASAPTRQALQYNVSLSLPHQKKPLLAPWRQPLCQPHSHSLRCSAAISLEQHFPALSRAGETRNTGTAIFHIPTCRENRKLPAAGEVCAISPFTKMHSFPEVKQLPECKLHLCPLPKSQSRPSLWPASPCPAVTSEVQSTMALPSSDWELCGQQGQGPHPPPAVDAGESTQLHQWYWTDLMEELQCESKGSSF